MLNFLIFVLVEIIFFLPALSSLKQGRYKKAGILHASITETACEIPREHVHYSEPYLCYLPHGRLRVFYNREDAWEVSRVATKAEEAGPIAPYYLISKLPDSYKEEFVLTPR